MTRILLIEDTTELARVIIRELEAVGYQVRHAVDGLDGVSAFQTYHPDLVILDWMLPRLDGLDVLHRIRQESLTPVLMLTARSEEADRVIGLELGADDYLTKPFGTRELVARVRALLRRIEHVSQIVETDREVIQSELEYGSLSLQPDGYVATVDGRPLDLTRTEFNMLVLFVRNPGRTFSRSYLLDTVWGVDYLPGDRAVDNTVLRLRKKLDQLGDSIETVWGIGYRLAAYD